MSHKRTLHTQASGSNKRPTLTPQVNTPPIRANGGKYGAYPTLNVIGQATETGVYAPLPAHVFNRSESLSLPRISNTPSVDVIQKLIKGVILNNVEANYVSKVESKVLLLDPPPSIPRKPAHGQKVMGKSEMKKKDFFALPNDERITYEQAKITNTMWLAYIKQIWDISMGSEGVQAKTHAARLLMRSRQLLSVDMHGCHLTVSHARNQSMVGIDGIVLQDSLRTFTVVTAKNVVKKLAKAGAIFTSNVDGEVLTWYGDGLIAEAQQKAKLKHESHQQHKHRRGGPQKVRPPSASLKSSRVMTVSINR
eukprot:CFRG3111T1